MRPGLSGMHRQEMCIKTEMEKLLRILGYMNIGTILLKRCIAVIWGKMKALS